MRSLTLSTQSLPGNPRPIHRDLITFRSHGLRLLHIMLILSLVLANFTALVSPALAAASGPAASEPVESASDSDSGDLDPRKAKGGESSDRITEVNLAEAEASPDNEAWQSAQLPALDAAGVSQYTGAATYSYPFWMPPGPGGLQPSLALNYNSQIIDAATVETQGTWVGLGWSLDTGYIDRDMHGTYKNLEDDTFSVVANGVSGLLLEGTDGFYHTASESFWRFKWVGDTWYAYDGMGNTYVFGEDAASRAEYPFYPDAQTCDQNAENWRWMLSRVTNKFDKSLTYTYYEKTQTTDFVRCNKTFQTTMAIYPERIIYPAGEDSYYVQFNLEQDAGYQPKRFLDHNETWENSDSRLFYRTYRLKSVVIYHEWRRIRSYEFTYKPVTTFFWDAAHWNYSLDSQPFAIGTITETGMTYSPSGSQVTLPPITFY